MYVKSDSGLLKEAIGEQADLSPQGAGRSSLFDRKLPLLLTRAEYLLTHGVFHLKIHFCGDQMTCWWFNDPWRYQVLRGEETFTEQAVEKCGSDSEIVGLVITDNDVAAALWGFQQLRQSQGDSYLRTASLNRVNGMLGLSFSCDNIHYLRHYEFPTFLEQYGISL